METKPSSNKLFSSHAELYETCVSAFEAEVVSVQKSTYASIRMFHLGRASSLVNLYGLVVDYDSAEYLDLLSRLDRLNHGF